MTRITLLPPFFFSFCYHSSPPVPVNRSVMSLNIPDPTTSWVNFSGSIMQYLHLAVELWMSINVTKCATHVPVRRLQVCTALDISNHNHAWASYCVSLCRFLRLQLKKAYTTSLYSFFCCCCWKTLEKTYKWKPVMALNLHKEELFIANTRS